MQLELPLFKLLSSVKKKPATKKILEIHVSNTICVKMNSIILLEKLENSKRMKIIHN